MEWLRARGRSSIAWGHTAHVLAGCLFCVCLAGPMSAVEVSAGILVGTGALRLHATWRLYGALVSRPVWWAWALVAAWWTLGLAWIEEMGENTTRPKLSCMPLFPPAHACRTMTGIIR